jgi:DMSO/TMAO reductase YedYZ molybdopterin-dependent catalytic subunit
MDDEPEPQLTRAILPDHGRTPVREQPLNAEASATALELPVTPRHAHYVRCHFNVPRLDAATHRLVVDGAVAAPFTVGVAELAALPQRSVTVTLECAGNDRLGMQPLPAGEPWGHGAASTASWSGVPLALLLERAGVRDDVVEVLLTGADRGVPGEGARPQAFARALPLDKARDPSVLVAVEMNGRPIPVEHGAPARLVVPGWYGMASVKWMARITALTQPFDGWFQRARYVYDDAEGARPVDVMRVKATVTAPADQATLPRGRVTVAGWAWSGAGPIAGVELSLDGGPWQPARLDAPLAPHAWRRFVLDVDVGAPGRHTLRARARDAAGRLQPDRAAWNRYGYGNNGIHVVVFNVA